MQRWEHNIKMDLNEMGWDCVDWLDMNHDKDKWQAVVHTAINLLCFIRQGTFWLDIRKCQFLKDSAPCS